MQIVPLDSLEGTIYGHSIIETFDGKTSRSGSLSSQVESDTLFVTKKGYKEGIPLSNIRVLYRLDSGGVTSTAAETLGIIGAFTGLAILFVVFLETW
ncbi:hypothetical protein ACFL3H_07915 [Gemmatimonadota bacterium]